MLVTHCQESPPSLRDAAPAGSASSIHSVVVTVFEGVVPLPALVTTTLLRVMLPVLRTLPL